MKTAQDYLDGQLVLIDKPLEWTSFQVVNKLRWHIRQAFNLKKIKVEKYFEFKSKYKTASYSTQKTKDIFLRTILNKLSMVRKKTATLLSGGLDSSSITSAIDYLNKK